MRVNPFRDRAALSLLGFPRSTGLLQHVLYPRTCRGMIPLLPSACPGNPFPQVRPNQGLAALTFRQWMKKSPARPLFWQWDRSSTKLSTWHCSEEIFWYRASSSSLEQSLCHQHEHTQNPLTPRLQGMVKSQSAFPWNPSFPALPSRAWRQLSQTLPR